jgi:hypothetical protein
MITGLIRHLTLKRKTDWVAEAQGVSMNLLTPNAYPLRIF